MTTSKRALKLDAARRAENVAQHRHDHGHGERAHSHGLVERSLVRSRAGVKAVSLSLGVLGTAALAQVVIFVLSNSVALLADLIHNFGDALTAVPLGIAFFLRSFRGREARRLRGRARDLRLGLRRALRDDPAPDPPAGPLSPVGAGGGRPDRLRRQRAGGGSAPARRPALVEPCAIADGNQARIDGLVSIGVVASAIVVALGARIGDPLIGLAITLVILKITWDSWRTVTTTEPGEPIDLHED